MKKFKNNLTNLVKKVKWFFKEIIKIYSAEDSYFSKKRIESGLAFIAAQFGMIYYLINKVDHMTTQDIVLWSGAEFLVAGYNVYQIQSEKKRLSKIEESTKKDEGPQILKG